MLTTSQSFVGSGSTKEEKKRAIAWNKRNRHGSIAMETFSFFFLFVTEGDGETSVKKWGKGRGYRKTRALFVFVGVEADGLT